MRNLMTWEMIMFIRRVSNYIIAFAFFPVVCSSQDKDEFLSVTGIYQNPVYEYSVNIPSGLTAKAAAPPAPNHGIQIVVSDKGAGAFIWCDGSYNSEDIKTPYEAMALHVKWIKEKDPSASVVSSNTRYLDTIKGIQFTVKYTDPESKTHVVEDIVIAIRSETDVVNIVYTIGLRTIEDHYQRDKSTFSSVASSFKLLKQ